MKILVTGADGMVGSYVKEVFSGQDLCLTDYDSMDITSFESVQKTFVQFKPDVVLHLAGATDVDRCEKEPDWAFKSNVIGTQNLAYVCQQNNIPLVYISTGGLFNGKKEESYTEFDVPDPVNVYAKTKLEGERVVQNLLNRYFIIRAGWMIGGGTKDKKFVGKMVERIQTQDEVFAVDDKRGAITYARDLLVTIRELIKTPFYGLYHVANHGGCTRYDIALEIKKILRSAVKVTPVSSERFPLPAPRSPSEIICNYKLALMGMDQMPPWQEALRHYLQKWL